MAAVVKVEKTEEFNKLLADSDSTLVVVHFSAPWAPQCQQMNDVMTELSKDSQLSNVKFVEIEAEGLAEISQKYQVVAVPTCLFFKNKKKIDRLDGAKVAELSKKVKQLASVGKDAVSPPKSVEKPDLNTRLKTLINVAPIMIFIKGTPEEPKCGFSRQLIQILNDKNIKYSFFNILADDEIRQGLKTFSNWPTYPQVYCKGELVGGLDIIKELVETGQLESELKAGGDGGLEERHGIANQESALTMPDRNLIVMPDLNSLESADSSDEKDIPQIKHLRKTNDSCHMTKNESSDGESQHECSETDLAKQQQVPVKIHGQNKTSRDKSETVRQNFRKRKKLEDCVSQLKEDCISSGQIAKSSGNLEDDSSASLELCLHPQTESSDNSCQFSLDKVKQEPIDHSELQFCYDPNVMGQTYLSDYNGDVNSNQGIHSYNSNNCNLTSRNKRKRSLNNVWKVNLKMESEKDYNELCQFRINQRRREKRLKLLENETSDPKMLSVLQQKGNMFEKSCRNSQKKCSKLLNYSNHCLDTDSTNNKIRENMNESFIEGESLVEVKQEIEDAFFDSHFQGDDLSDMCMQSSDDSQFEQEDIGEEWLPNSDQKEKFRKQQISSKSPRNSGYRRRRKRQNSLSEEIRRQKNTEYRRRRRQQLRLSNPEKLEEEREKDRTRKQMLRKRNQLLLSLPPDLLSEAAGLAANTDILDDEGNPVSIPFPFSSQDNIEDLKQKEEQRRATNRERMRLKRLNMDGLTKEKIKLISREKMRLRRQQLRENDPVAAAMEREKQKLKKREERKRNAILLSLPDETLKEAANNTEILQAAIASLSEGTPGNCLLKQLPLDSETAANLAKLRAHLEMKRAEAAERVRRKRAELREKDPEQAAAIREREKIRKRIERRRNTLLLSLPPDELVRVTMASITEGENVPFQLPNLLALSSGHLPSTSLNSCDPSLAPAVPHLTEELVKMREKLERKRALDRERMRQRRAKLKENPEAAAAFKEKERLRKQMERWKKSMGLFDSTKSIDSSLDPSLLVAGFSGKEVSDASFVSKSLLSMFSLGSPDFNNKTFDHTERGQKPSQDQSSAYLHNSVLSNSSVNMSGYSSNDSSFSLSNSAVVSEGEPNTKKSVTEHLQNGSDNACDTNNAVKTELSPEEMERLPKGFDSNEEQDIQMEVDNKEEENLEINFSQSVAQLVSPSVMRIVPSLFEDEPSAENAVTNVLTSSSQSVASSHDDAALCENGSISRHSTPRKTNTTHAVSACSDLETTEIDISKSFLQDEVTSTVLHDPGTVKRAQEWFIYHLSILQNKMGDRFLQLDPNPKHLDPVPGGIAAQLTPMQLLLVQQLIGPMPLLPGQTSLDPHAFELKLTEMMMKGYEYREQNRNRARNYRDRLKNDPDYKDKYEQKKQRDLERKRLHRARESELRCLYPEYDQARRQQQRRRHSRPKSKKKNQNVDSDDSQSDIEGLHFEMSQSIADGSSDPIVQDLNKVTSDILSVYSKLDREPNGSKLTKDKKTSGYNLRDVSSAKKLKFVYDENYDDSMDSEPCKRETNSKKNKKDSRLRFQNFKNSSDSDDNESVSDGNESSAVLDASH